MSKVIATRDKKALLSAGFRLDKIIHRRRRERDIKIKTSKYLGKVK